MSGGGLIWAFRAGLTTVSTEGFGLDPVLIYRIGLALSFVLYFFMNVHFIFQVQDRLAWRLTKYSLVSMSFLSLDGLLMQFLHQQLGWHYFLALSASTTVLLLIKFVVYNFLVFQPTRGEPNPPLS